MHNYPRPKFYVGEEVAIDNNEVGDAVTDKAEIVYMEYFKNIGCNKLPGWWYGFNHIPEGEVIHELALRKLPPSKRISWGDTYFNPHKDEILPGIRVYQPSK